MANYSDSLWLAAEHTLNEIMQKPEFKAKPSSALMVFLKNRDFLIPASSREAAWNQKESDTQAVTIKTLNKQASSSASARSHNHTGSINDSSSTTVTYTIYAEKFKYSIKQADRNIFELGAQLAAQLRSAFINLHSAIETALMTSLNTNKSQVVVSLTPRSGQWDASNFIFQVAAADSARYFQWLDNFMKEEFYTGRYDVISDAFLAAEGAFLSQQGLGNATNLGWQMGNIDHVMSTGLTVAGGYQGMSYILEQGMVGILDWIPKLNRIGDGDVRLVGGRYSSMPDPMGSGLTFAIHEYATAVDNSSNAAETQDVDIQVEVSVDLGPVYAPMSTSNASPVYKAGLLI